MWRVQADKMCSLQVYICFCGLPQGGTVMLRLLDDVAQEPSSSNWNILLSESFRILSTNSLNSAGHLRNTSRLCGHIYYTCLFVLSVYNKSNYLVMHFIQPFYSTIFTSLSLLKSAIFYFLIQLFLTFLHEKFLEMCNGIVKYYDNRQVTN